ncbi:GNAT family N-acetyltransferase [Paraliobacillus ryukyuensis]|uniref:GNAT family N-acetyltransferase n=1 Tax=Paraliobacillus ryukyuensis TaxID=200904 RepID=UPI0009A87BC6|nr:GNAT family N-acetyltransferase [Paraliobacillus ryukyuensis]
MNYLNNENENLKLRLANEKDCNIIFSWTNDVTVRKNAFNSEFITFKQHQKWFRLKLDSDKSKIYIGYINEIPIGQIRIDIINEIGIIDYSIDSNYRGKGYGTLFLKKIESILIDELVHLKSLVGKVKYDNIASQKAFTKAAYCEEKYDNYLLYSKDIIS